MSNEIHRRNFLKQTSAAAAGLILMPSWAKKVAASDRLRIAIVGVGGMGNSHLKWFAGLPDVEVVALCDVDETHLAESLKTLGTLQPSFKAQGYADFRRILDRKDIDAISCATPDHWHAQIATMAFQA